KIISVLQKEENPQYLAEKFQLSESVLNATLALIEEMNLINKIENTDIKAIYKQLNLIYKNKQLKLKALKKIIDTRQCKRKFLLSYFGEAYSGNCQNCNICI